MVYYRTGTFWNISGRFGTYDPPGQPAIETDGLGAVAGANSGKRIQDRADAVNVSAEQGSDVRGARWKMLHATRTLSEF